MVFSKPCFSDWCVHLAFSGGTLPLGMKTLPDEFATDLGKVIFAR